MHQSSLILNADDWGRDSKNTQSILKCFQAGALSSVSAMVFMEDSEHAAQIARELGIDAGLHLNFTSVFDGSGCSSNLVEKQKEVGHFLRRSPFARAIYHPGLTRSTEYVVRAQIDEFERIYQKPVDRIDGHHHMHLAANVLFGHLLPKGVFVRPHFTFEKGEKIVRNSVFRLFSAAALGSVYKKADFLFNLKPMDESRLSRIFSLARKYMVEVETHPIDPEELDFLLGVVKLKLPPDVPIAGSFGESRSRQAEPNNRALVRGSL